jgi:hypothetical protein
MIDTIVDIVQTCMISRALCICKPDLPSIVCSANVGWIRALKIRDAASAWTEDPGVVSDQNPILKIFDEVVEVHQLM